MEVFTLLNGDASSAQAKVSDADKHDGRALPAWFWFAAWELRGVLQRDSTSIPPSFCETSAGMLVWELPGSADAIVELKTSQVTSSSSWSWWSMVDGLYINLHHLHLLIFSPNWRFRAIQCMNSPKLPGVFCLFCQERWAEVQGSVSGLLEETQALARRLDGLDERLWARTSGLGILEQFDRDNRASPKTTVLAFSLWPSKFRGTPKIQRFFFSKHELFLYIYIYIIITVFTYYICRIFCCPECE